MRLVALGALLFAVYAATLSIPATAGEDFTADEAHLLLGARSWADDGDVDLADQYAERHWRPEYWLARSRSPSSTHERAPSR